jgi:hypothetical protein
MASKDKSPPIAIGFRVKTGRATAVVIAVPASAPRVLSRKSLQLFDPAIPESHQPFHAQLEPRDICAHTPAKIAVAELGRAIGKPWSAEEKAAAAAAWIALAG